MISKLVHWTRHFPRFSVLTIITVFFMGVAIFTGCTSDGDDLLDDLFRSPNVEPIRASIKTAVPLAHAAAVSMAAMQGAIGIGDGVQILRTSGFPSAAVIEFPIDPDDMPYAFDEGSRAVVTGFWSSPDQAILTVAFFDTTAGVSSFEVLKVATFPVKAVDFPQPGYMVVYANADININVDPDPADLSDDEKETEFDRLGLTADEVNPDVNIALDAWIIEVDIGGSLNDFTDDEYTISGGGQYVDVTSNGGNTATGVYQLGLAGIRVDSSCSRNPLGGFSLVQELGVDTGDDIPLAASALLYFNGNCNGRIHVTVATGNFIASIGSTLDFNLNQP